MAVDDRGACHEVVGELGDRFEGRAQFLVGSDQDSDCLAQPAIGGAEGSFVDGGHLGVGERSRGGVAELGVEQGRVGRGLLGSLDDLLGGLRKVGGDNGRDLFRLGLGWHGAGPHGV